MLLHGGTPTGWHTKWVSDQRLDPVHPNVLTHETMCRAVEALGCYDQSNAPNMASAELMMRQVGLCEERERIAKDARKDSKKDAKGDDLKDETHLMLGGGHQRENLCICPALKEWIAEELRKESQVLKERRKAREERALRREKG